LTLKDFIPVKTLMSKLLPVLLAEIPKPRNESYV
jgi:hypothetical protein